MMNLVKNSAKRWWYVYATMMVLYVGSAALTALSALFERGSAAYILVLCLAVIVGVFGFVLTIKEIYEHAV